MAHKKFSTEQLIERFTFASSFKNYVFGLIGVGIVLMLTGLFFASNADEKHDEGTGHAVKTEQSDFVQIVDQHEGDHDDQEHDQKDEKGADHGESEHHDEGHGETAVHADTDHGDGHGGGHHHREITYVNRASANFLLNNIYFFTLAIGALFFLAVHQIGNAGWHTAIRRVPEAMTSYLMVAAIGFVILFFLMPYLYEWAILPKGADKLIDLKRAYLNENFFIIRNVIFLGLWIGAAYLLRKYSTSEDGVNEGDLKNFKRSTKVSAAFVFVFAFTFTLFAVDWVKSLEPHWFSTIFGVYMFAGSFLTTMAATSLILYFLKRQGYMSYVNASHFHDVNKFLFGFAIFWAYIWVAQFLLIWYSNIPEEGVYYIKRMRSGDPEHYMGYRFLFFLNLFLNFIVPFFGFMTRNAKRNPATFVPICIIVLIGHWLDLFVMIMPGAVESSWHIGLLELGFFLTFAGIFLYVVLNALTKANLVPLKHPYLEESLHHSTGAV